MKKSAKADFTLLLFICIWLKFILFNFIWCYHTTFTAFSTIEIWLTSITAALLLLFPYICFGAMRVTWVVMLLLDLLLLSNLMYMRTYYTVIPLESYLLLSNLKDFTGSVTASFRIEYLVFFILTLIPAVQWKIKERKGVLVQQTHNRRKLIRNYGIITGILILAIVIPIVLQGGFKKKYESLQNANMHSCRTPMFTLFGSLYYDFLKDKEVLTPEMEDQINKWFASKKPNVYPSYETQAPENIILILAESFESWVLEREVEGKEITPYLNALLQKENVVYAPNVLSQVKGGRSIDAQLLCNTGLLPVQTGSYSTRFPENYYPSLVKAFKQKNPEARANVLTVDKHIVWNQHMIAPAFGYDGLIDRKGFTADEKVGPRKKVGDASFLRQCGDKILSGEVWNKEGNDFLQLVTYSGHAPFILPDELKRIVFNESYPQMLADYMYMANYTDYAIGEFIQRLDQEGILENTMIIITGDHEGLADNRGPLRQSTAGSGLVSDKPYTPLIVINAPVGMRYEKVMGQIDIYPTILELAGLTRYEWQGLGQSICNPDKLPFAINAAYEVYGDTADNTETEIKHMREAWDISDLIIRYDLLNTNRR